jgi:orotate phosphoribosyltransferase
MNRIDLARAIRDAALLRGEFILRSGATSSLYWDKYRFESNPSLLAAVTAELQHLLPPSFDRLAGLELGGIPLATALSLQTGKPALYVRKAPKEYGTRNVVEGGFQPGERVIIVEDVITSGGQVVLSVRELRDLGLIVDHAICVIDREQGGRENLAATGCTLSTVFTMSQLENA